VDNQGLAGFPISTPESKRAGVIYRDSALTTPSRSLVYFLK